MTATLNPELEERRRDFEAAKRAVHELVSDLSDEDFNRRVDQGSWCVAECVEHLNTTGSALLPKLEEGIEKGRAKGWSSDAPFRYGVIEKYLERSMTDQLLPPWKVKTPKLYVPPPAPDRSISETLARFDALQDNFIALLERADGLDLARIKVSSPVTRLLRLSLGQWFYGMAGHQRRHFWQARQVRQRLPALTRQAEPRS